MTITEYFPPPPGAEPMPDVDAELLPTGDDRHPPDDQPPRLPLRERLLTLDALGKLPPVRPLVDGLLYRGTLAQLSGPPGSYKSFLTVALACSVALGEPFEGHRVPEAGTVIYVVAEGASGIRSRVLAWCSLAGIDPRLLEDRLYFLPEPVQLGSHLDVTDIVQAAVDLDARLVILDTRARCTLGLEENSATEQGRAIHAAEQITHATDATVLAVHHSGRSGTHGRGSNAWDGAVWSNLQITSEDMRATIKCEKHKDVPDGCEHHYRMVEHIVPEDLMPGCDTGQRSTLVALQMGPLENLAADRRSTRAVLDIVWKKAGIEGLSRKQIIDLASEQNVAQSTVYGAVNDLVKAAALRNVGTESRPRYVLTGAQTTLMEAEQLPESR